MTRSLLCTVFNFFLMTRINLIPVSELTDQHLLSEHREIKRIPNIIASGRYSLEWIPDKYTMGKWHVKFFYKKLKFVHDRYILIYNECLKRWFNIECYIDSFIYFPWTYNDYTPTPEAIQISRDRINEKIAAKPWFYRKNWVLISNL